VWVQDYQLILVGRELKRLGIKRRTGFFLHIPFPPLDIFLKLPWRFEILEALLAYDLIGFQTVRDLRNFIGCVRALFSYKVMKSRYMSRILLPDRETLVGAFPISIDFNEFEELARTDEVAEAAWILHSNLPNRQLILGVDRLDYTKGIPERLLAFGHALACYPDMRKKVTLIQVVVPSRVGVARIWKSSNRRSSAIVGEINGKFTEIGWNADPLYDISIIATPRNFSLITKLLEIATGYPVETTG
jgi:trehalose 6-phosphate synthase